MQIPQAMLGEEALRIKFIHLTFCLITTKMLIAMPNIAIIHKVNRAGPRTKRISIKANNTTQISTVNQVSMHRDLLTQKITTTREM